MVSKEKTEYLYFLPYGLKEAAKCEEPVVDDQLIPPKQEELPKMEDIERLRQPTFWYYFLNWGGVILAFLSMVIVILGCFEWEKDWMSVDPNAVPDYALASAGAMIVGKPEAKTYNTVLLKSKLMTFPEWVLPSVSNPEAVLQPWNSPGECWAFAGQTAKIKIRLSHMIIPKLITLEHIPANISPVGDIRSAPKDFSVHAVDDNLLEYMGDFQYTGETPQQTFMLRAETNLKYPYQVLQFSFYSNHGHPRFTCIYKIRVHGILFSY